MEFIIQYLSFFMVQPESESNPSGRRYKHFQTLDQYQYVESEIRFFLDGELARICKRKVEKYPNHENAPTKVGSFITEPGHELTSNPNYNMFQRLRASSDKEQFSDTCNEIVELYTNTGSARGGAIIVVLTKLPKYFDDPILFILKCDFEQKIARIADERQLIHHVDNAISAKNMKSIMYPHIPEPGMLEESELKVHQANHAKYFEDFLRFVSYEKAKPEMISETVVGMVYDYMQEKYQNQHSDERRKEEEELELWAASPKRELQEKWSIEQVQEASQHIIAHQPDVSVSFKLDDLYIKAPLADFGSKLQIAKYNGKYILVLTGDSLVFDRHMSPIELLTPADFNELVNKVLSQDVPF